jgi:hypothetical protein
MTCSIPLLRDSGLGCACCYEPPSAVIAVIALIGNKALCYCSGKFVNFDTAPRMG